MAIRAAIATGSATNFLTAGTWGVVDSTTYQAGENAAIVLPTTYGSTARSATKTPGAIDVVGVGLKLNVRTGTTGTMTVHLANVSDHSEIAGTSVVIDTADLPDATASALNGGWIFFKFAATVTLPATAIEVEAKTSSGSMVSLWRHDATAGNLSYYLRTTTTGAPAATDDLIITGEYVDQNTNTAAIVTMNETATTDYGSTPTAANSLLTPGIAICQNGTLSYGVAASTNYYLKMSNCIIVYDGGTFNIGTVGAEIPRNSSAVLNFDPGANVDYGLVVRNGGTFVSQGLSRTTGKNVYSCKLNADSPANDTVLDVDTDTGWLDNDELAVASTTRTSTDCENGTINVTVSATQITVDGFAGTGGGLAVAHSGTSPTQAEVILLTRNVQIFGASASLQAYILTGATATIDCDWTEFKWLGSATSGKRGLDIACTTGAQSFQYCSFHDFSVASSRINFSGSSGTGLTFSNNVTYAIANIHISTVGTSGSVVMDSNIFMKNTDANVQGLSLADVGSTFTNNTVVGMTGVGFIASEITGIIGTWNNITVHSCGSNGITLGSATVLSGTISTITVWRCLSRGVDCTAGSNVGFGELTLTNLTLFGNNVSNMAIVGGRLTLNSPILNGDTTFATTNGITINGGIELIINNGDLGTASGIKAAHTNDINIIANAYARVLTVNTKLASANPVGTQANMSASSLVSAQRLGTTAGNHKTWKEMGTIDLEGTIVHTGSQSLRMLPTSTTTKLESSGAMGGFKVAVANGSTCTPSVYVYESAAYNGNRCRLILKRNDAIGVTADAVIDTRTGASDAAWEQMTGTAPTSGSFSDDGVAEFVVDCDGDAATGYVYLDSFTCT